ncbi:MAG: 2-phosphosulfolactate phosphatase [Bacteroidales bacterium]|nr:2-phosphosulfolactate phosphatase [Bacteroidales bacterium]
MKIEIVHLVSGAKQARGLTVVIDVFRAFSLACYLTDQGAERIVPVGDINLAHQLKKAHPDYILIGERENKKPKGFDFGNSPFQVRGVNFFGKTIVHTTSAGTQGIVNATNADEILTGSFVNVEAVINYIKAKQPEQVSLVCMGYSANHPTEEDTFCAEYIKNSLENNLSDFNQMVNIIMNTSGKRFFDPEKSSYCPPEDFDLCLNLNRFNFVLKANTTDEGLFELRKI